MSVYLGLRALDEAPAQGIGPSSHVGATKAEPRRTSRHSPAQSAECADADEPPPTAVRDPDDDYLVDLLRRSGADVLVSVDRDLLDAQLPGVAVLDSAQFLSRMTSEASDTAA